MKCALRPGVSGGSGQAEALPLPQAQTIVHHTPEADTETRWSSRRPDPQSIWGRGKLTSISYLKKKEKKRNHNSFLIPLFSLPPFLFVAYRGGSWVRDVTFNKHPLQPLIPVVVYEVIPGAVDRTGGV